MCILRRQSSPHPERTIHVDPSASIAGSATNLFSVIESACIHIAGLNAHDCLFVEFWQGINPHSALGVGGHRSDPGPPEAEHGQCSQHRDVHLLAHDDMNGGGAEHPVFFQIPTRFLEDGGSGGGESREICHGCTGNESHCAT